MRLYVDLDTLQVVTAPGVTKPLEKVELKRGDAAVIQVQFLELGSVPTRLPEGAALVFVAKAAGDYDGSPLAICDSWVTPDAGAFDYTCRPNFNTTQINTLLESDGIIGNDLPYIPAMFEITWVVGLELPTSTKTTRLVIYNDIFKGSEASPTPASLSYPPPSSLLTQADAARFALVGHTHLGPQVAPVASTVLGAGADSAWVQRNASELKSFLSLVVPDINGLTAALAAKADAESVAISLALKADADSTAAAIAVKADVPANAAALARVYAVPGGAPLWDGATWPGGQITDSGEGVSLIADAHSILRKLVAGSGITLTLVGGAIQINAMGLASGPDSIVVGYSSDSFTGIPVGELSAVNTGWGWAGAGTAIRDIWNDHPGTDDFTGIIIGAITEVTTGTGWAGAGTVST